MTIRRIILDDSYESVKIELNQIKEQLLQKENENQELKKKVFEWKKMALENESLFQAARQQYQSQEQNLLARHKSEMDALTTAHVEKMNDVSKTIISLQQSQHVNQDQSSKHIYDLVEDSHKETASKVIYHRQKATDLILNMNELMTEIETKIHGYVHDDVNESDVNENVQIYSVTTNAGNDDIHLHDRRPMLDEPMKKAQLLDPSLSQLDIDSIHRHPRLHENTSHPFSSLSSSSFYGSYTSSPTSSRSSVSIEPVSPLHRPQQIPQLKTKPTMEHLTKVIPNFLLKKTPSKSEQWKVTHRRSFINGPS